jgi:hypothetical protein
MPQHEVSQLDDTSSDPQRKRFKKKASAPNPLAVKKSSKVQKPEKDEGKSRRKRG